MVLHCVLLQMSVQNIFLVRKKILKRDIDIVWRQMRSFYNSKFRDRLYYNDERYSNARLIDWNRRNGNSPYVFKVEDFDLLINAKNKVFARKFEEDEYEVVDKLYQLLK
jgi:hypothetical protein